MPSSRLWKEFHEGMVIPAMPLTLDARRRFDPLAQRELVRYYQRSGAGGLAVGVHTTQFEIRERGLYEPVLALASAVLGPDTFKVAGVCGRTPQALKEAATARSLGYHAALLSLAALKGAPPARLAAHCREVSQAIPLIGFYLQSAVGGAPLPLEFWRRFFGIRNVVAVKIAPFNRYQTYDVVRALAESGREKEITLYTGNDDNIVLDLLTPWPVGKKTLWIKGGLLGHWAVNTRRAVELMARIRRQRGRPLSAAWLKLAAQVTDSNAAYFDAANGFKGCIAGIHEVLRRQGLMPNILCLDPKERLSRGQAAEITRVQRAYPHMQD